MKRDEFEARKKASREKHSKKQNAPKVLASASADLTNYPFLQALANREELVRAGKLTSIIFIRDMKKGATEQEVSVNTSRLRPDRIVLCVLCAVRCTVCCTSTVRCCTSSLAPTHPPHPPLALLSLPLTAGDTAGDTAGVFVRVHAYTGVSSCFVLR